MLQRLRLSSPRAARMNGNLAGALVQNWLHAETARPIVLFQIGNVILVRFGLVSALALLFGLASFIVIFRSMDMSHEVLAVLLIVSPASLIFFSFVQGLLFSARRTGQFQGLRNITFGFFGGLFGLLLTFVIAARAANMNVLLLFDATALLGSFIHAYARTACINYGCCHGKEIQGNTGHLHMVYHSPLSKAVRVSDLSGRPLYPVQLYESLGCLLIGCVILFLANTMHRVGMLAGTYLLLYGALRFVCEYYRGEKDTLFLGNYTVYQWISALFVICGAGLLSSAAVSDAAKISVSLADAAGFLREFTVYLVVMPALILFFYGFHYRRVGKWC